MSVNAVSCIIVVGYSLHVFSNL